ncbi:hypothetical protein [Okeania sp. KiyG1]|uniref:hypothetical protein n=1 Tax=Okeania sp. KiyG1 TaxID=2720165 RepID=UPI0019BA0DD6|nr:hypothetical protein [Okeania sp. KiyG1]GFZ97545.1 hypothetical protein CYANOKiyG1_08820 [Okeania sp. KiyG1]
MAFSDFKTISDVQKKYRIKYSEENFIVSQELLPSDSFIKDFEFNKEHIDLFASEASRSETIISPLLREVYKNIIRNIHFGFAKVFLMMKFYQEHQTIFFHDVLNLVKQY